MSWIVPTQLTAFALHSYTYKLFLFQCYVFFSTIIILSFVLYTMILLSDYYRLISNNYNIPIQSDPFNVIATTHYFKNYKRFLIFNTAQYLVGKKILTFSWWLISYKLQLFKIKITEWLVSSFVKTLNI